jgi:type IV pilus assembly protein PilE
MKRTRGFTLLELMIVVGIVAILASMAIPAYSEYVRRGRITEATATLAGMRVKMEQYFQDNRTYVNACGAPGSSVAPLPPATVNFTYACAIVAGPPSTYTMTATGRAGTVVEGFQYTMDDTNRRTTVMAAPSTWPGSANCWVLKKDGTC